MLTDMPGGDGPFLILKSRPRLIGFKTKAVQIIQTTLLFGSQQIDQDQKAAIGHSASGILQKGCFFRIQQMMQCVADDHNVTTARCRGVQIIPKVRFDQCDSASKGSQLDLGQGQGLSGAINPNVAPKGAIFQKSSGNKAIAAAKINEPWPRSSRFQEPRIGGID
jgi:hypothetical protein